MSAHKGHSSGYYYQHTSHVHLVTVFRKHDNDTFILSQFSANMAYSSGYYYQLIRHIHPVTIVSTQATFIWSLLSAHKIHTSGHYDQHIRHIKLVTIVSAQGTFIWSLLSAHKTHSFCNYYQHTSHIPLLYKDTPGHLSTHKTHSSGYHKYICILSQLSPQKPHSSSHIYQLTLHNYEVTIITKQDTFIRHTKCQKNPDIF